MAEKIEGLSIGLDLETIQLERGLTGLKDRLRTVNSEMKNNMSAFDRGDRSIQKYDTRIQGLNKKLETQRKVTEQSQREYEKMVEEHGRGSVEAEKAERAYNNQAAALNNLERYVENATEELEAMRKEQEFLDSGWGRMTTNLDNFSKKSAKWGDTLTGVGKTMSTRVTAPIVALGGAAVASADQVDKAYRDIRVSSGTTGEALEELEKSFDNVFTGVPDAAEQVSGALSTLNTHTGATGEVLEGLTTNVLDVSRLLKEDATANADAFGKALEQWQRPAEDGAAALDYLYTLTQDYNVGLGEISGHLTTYGAVLNNAGFEMEEAAEFMARLEANGISVSRVMPGLNSAFRRWAAEGKNTHEELQRVINAVQDAETNTEALTIATEEFGAEGAQRLMTAIRNDAIPALDDLGAGAEDAKGSISETTEETKTMGEQFQELKNNTIIALRPVGDILLELAKDALPPVIDGVTRLAEWFDDLDDNTKNTILATMGVTAALGPASLALGTTLNAASGLAGGLSKVTGMIGRKSGAGLLGRIGLMGAGTATPVGLAIAGIGLLGGTIYLLSRDTERLHDVNYDLIDSVEDEIKAITDLEERFKELHNQNNLTSEEMLRYMDIMTELEQAGSEETIKKLSDEQENLLEKSGMTNKEMEEFIRLNNDIVDNTPNVTTAISDQGNAYIDNLDVLKDLNAEKVESLILDAQRELEKALENENTLLQKQIDLGNEIEQTQIEINETQQARLEIMPELTREQEEQKRIDQEMKTLKEEIKGLDGQALIDAQEKYIELEDQKLKQDEIVRGLEQEKDWMDEHYDQLRENVDQKRESLDTTTEELEKIQGMIGDYEQLILKRYDLNAEQGKGLDAIDRELEKLEQEQIELDKINSKTAAGVEGYEDQNRKLDEQRQRLLNAQRELEEINRLAGETIYQTHHTTYTYSGNPAPHNRQPRPIPTYAKGTKSLFGHRGGDAILGDGIGSNAGRELVSLPSGKMFLSADRPTLYPSLPKGTEVIPANKTRKIFNSIPRYATGTGSGVRNEFTSLLALTGREQNRSAEGAEVIQQSNDAASPIEKLLEATLQQNEILIRLLRKDNNLYLDTDELKNNINEKNAVDAALQYF